MSVFAEFKKFAMRGSVVDLASRRDHRCVLYRHRHFLVNDVLMPPIGLALAAWISPSFSW
jgi:large-conductance mechanosensitive channel